MTVAMNKFFLVILPVLIIAQSATAESCTREHFLEAAAAVSTSFIDPNLPDVPLEEWMTKLQGAGTNSGTEAGACDEPSINPFIQSSRDIPICVGLQRDLRTASDHWIRIVVRMGSTMSCSTYTPQLVTANIARAKDKNSKGDIVEKFTTLGDLESYLAKNYGAKK